MFESAEKENLVNYANLALLCENEKLSKPFTFLSGIA